MCFIEFRQLVFSEFQHKHDRLGVISKFVSYKIFILKLLSIDEVVFFYTHLGFFLNFTVVFHCLNRGGISPPSRGIVGKNWSTQNKTTVRTKRVV